MRLLRFHLFLFLVFLTGCSQFSYAPEPMISDYKATVLTRGLVMDKGVLIKVTDIDANGIFEHLHVNHIPVGFRTVRFKCTFKYADDMNWIVSEEEYLLEPKYCYVPRLASAWPDPECRVELARTSCSNLKSLAVKEQPTFRPISWREEIPVTE